MRAHVSDRLEPYVIWVMGFALGMLGVAVSHCAMGTIREVHHSYDNENHSDNMSDGLCLECTLIICFFLRCACY